MSLGALDASAQVDGFDAPGPRPANTRPAPEPHDMRWYPEHLTLAPPFVGELVGGRDDPQIVYAGEAVFRAGKPPVMPAELRKPLEVEGRFAPGYFLVHFATDIRPAHKERLDLVTGVTRRADGTRLARWYVPNNAMVVWVDTPETLEVLGDVGGVDWIGRYEPGYKLDPRIGSITLSSEHRVGRDTWQLNVDLVPGHSVAAVVDELEALGVRVLERVERRGTSVYDLSFVVVECAADQVLPISGIEGVRLVQESGDGLQLHDLSAGGKLQNRQLRKDNSTDSPIVTAATFPLWLEHDLQGQGQVIGVVDSSFAWSNTVCLNDVQNLGSYPNGAIDNFGFANPVLSRALIKSIGVGGVSLKIPRADVLGGATLGGFTLEHGVGVAGAALADYYGNDSQTWWEHDIDHWAFWNADLVGLAGPGIAHEAQLYATPVLDSSGNFRWENPGEFEQHMRTTLGNMASAGVSVTNHSAGIVETFNTYTQVSIVHDTAAFDHPNVLQCMAAGNSGAGSDKLTSQAVVKNALTVGASDDVLNPEARVDFSSTGPRFDGGLKPDLLAPGADTPARSGGSGSGLVLPEWSAVTGCPVQITQGTSFASPIMAGAAALIHQYFEEGRYPGSGALDDASAALMKAMLINAGHRLTGANLGDGTYPNMYQGWGEPNLSDVLDFGPGPRRLIVEDVPRAAGFLSGGDPTRDLTFAVDGSAERLRVTLVWTDEPGTVGSGKKLINDLDLRVTAPDGTVYRGNVINGTSGLSVTGGQADTLNNVENVILAAPATGTWVASVDPGAGNYAVGQGYALVVTGQVSESAPAPPLAGFSALPTTGDAPLAVSFTNESTGASSYSWDFGDGNGSSQANPSHTYASAGTYAVTLTASGAAGSDVEVKTGYIVVTTGSQPNPPVATFTGAPTSGTAPLVVSFQDQSSGAITSRSWDFGDGNGSSAANPNHTYTSPGTYTVSLTVSGPDGTDVETRAGYVVVSPPVTGSPPSADFTGGPTEGPAPLIVGFSDVSTGNVTSRLWDFGDGGTSTDQHPLHTYTAAGSYTVSLTVTGPDGSDTLTRPGFVTINPTIVAPVSEFTAAPTTGGTPLVVSFQDQCSGTVTSRIWDFGDGTISQEVDPVHTYNSPGTYTVSLTVSGPGGNSVETKSDYILVESVFGPPPTAGFTSSAPSGNAPHAVSFQDTTDGAVSSWLWDFGDGTTSTAINPSHTYSGAGTFTVSLTVSGPTGSDTETKAGYVTVGGGAPSAPVAGFAANPTAGTAPLAVNFLDASSGEITGRSWSFGDGSSSTATSPNHVYSSPGTYTVSLTVSGPGGSDTETKAGLVTVSEPEVGTPPVADFGSSVTVGVAPFDVHFLDASTGEVTSRLWSFGDGATSTQQHPYHTYDQPGTYTVSLAVTGPDGSDTMTKAGYVTIESPSAGTTGRFYMSFNSATQVPGVGQVQNEDVVLYDAATNSWSMYFDGSDVGLAGTDVNAVHVLDNGDLLYSIKSGRFTLPGLYDAPDGVEQVDDSDIVWFQFTSAGEDTSGYHVLYLDGSDVGLTKKGEDIDGVHELPGGGLAVSFVGPAEPGSLLEVLDEDVLFFTSQSYGSDTVGTWSRWFDGDQVEFQRRGEDVDGLSVEPDGSMLFSTVGRWIAAGGEGMDEDIGRFVGTFGENTSGTASLLLDVSLLGIQAREDVDAFSHKP